MQRVEREQFEYGDIVIATGFTDSRDSLSRKRFFSMQYAASLPFEFKYFIQCDSDAYVQFVSNASAPLCDAIVYQSNHASPHCNAIALCVTQMKRARKMSTHSLSSCTYNRTPNKIDWQCNVNLLTM
jgi:hypothetical protein